MKESMNHASFLAVLAATSFGLPIVIRLLKRLSPAMFIGVMIIIVLLTALYIWYKQLWYKQSYKRTKAPLPIAEPTDFSSPLLNTKKQDEDYHASL
jgi:hypothetical protein